jgi:hypothetical protein
MAEQVKAPEGDGTAKDAIGVQSPQLSRIWYCLRHTPGDLLRYLYFMRFSLILWLSMPLLVVLDFFPGIATITRGILTPFSPSQWIITGFVVVVPGWFALLAARIVCSYGNDRFETPEPICFHVFDKMEGAVFWGAQVPGLILLARIAYNVVHEGNGSYWAVYLCLATGGLAATVFWYLIAILYYWTYEPDTKNPARAFLVPKWKRLPLDDIEKLPLTFPLRLFQGLMGSLCRLGPGYEKDGKLRPGHFVASIALLSAVFLYVLMMPISAPVVLLTASRIMRITSIILLTSVFFLILIPAIRSYRQPGASRTARSLPLLASLVLLGLISIGVWQPFSPRLIPVVGYVVILFIVVFWALSGVAFFADHYRIPVFTLAAAIILLINQWPAEHVFPARPVPDSETSELLALPEDYVKRLAVDSEGQTQPVIIVTATGGGIHSAAWTATVLTELEKAFGERKFHDHILLMSTVSGGSVAGATYLREYFSPQPFGKNSLDRIQGAARCSSLQAVAWGLAYPDTLRLLFPWFFNSVSQLDRFDRGWALEKALERNMHDPECIANKEALQESVSDPSSLTLDALARLPKTLPGNTSDALEHFPAFTLNTTAVETGDRFLLSNYSVLGDPANNKTIPAASFLGVYSRQPTLPAGVLPDPKRGGFADISLITAARLSASFTYVSPATRLPFEMSEQNYQDAFHFVDGGYYDNDGTSSVIEFLDAALEKPGVPPLLNVLLLEIRNGYDIDLSDNPDSYGHQGHMQWDAKSQSWKEAQGKDPGRWGPVGQLLAPPKAAIQAGFNSVTRRNRRELETLEAAHRGSLFIQHIVLDYQQAITPDKKDKSKVDSGESEVDQPLSWHLTQRQEDWIEGNDKIQGGLDRGTYTDDKKIPHAEREKICEALVWFDSKRPAGTKPAPTPESCKISPGKP